MEKYKPSISKSISIIQRYKYLLLAIFLIILTNNISCNHKNETYNDIQIKKQINVNLNLNKTKTFNLAELYFNNKIKELISFTNKFSHGKFQSKIYNKKQKKIILFARLVFSLRIN